MKSGKYILPIVSILSLLALVVMSACSASEPKKRSTPRPTLTRKPTLTLGPTSTPKPPPTITPVPSPLPAEVFEGGLVVKSLSGSSSDIFELFEMISSPDQPMQYLPMAEEVTSASVSPDGKRMYYVIGGDYNGRIKTTGMYWYNLETDEKKQVSEDAHALLEWSPNGQWIHTLALMSRARSTYKALYAYDLDGNQVIVFQPPSQMYKLANSNAQMRLYGGVSGGTWVNNETLIFNYYGGSMPAKLTEQNFYLEPDSIGMVSITPPEPKFTKSDAETMKAAAQNSVDDVNFDGSWVLIKNFTDHINSVAKNEGGEQIGINKSVFLPCPDCGTIGFVPGSNDLYYMVEGETVNKIFTAAPDTMQATQVGQIEAAAFCQPETAANPDHELEKWAKWSGVWVGDISTPKIAVVEHCRDADALEMHEYVTLLDLTSGAQTRLFEVNWNSVVMAWVAPHAPVEPTEAAQE